MTELEIAAVDVGPRAPPIMDDKKEVGMNQFVEEPTHGDHQDLLKSRFDEMSIPKIAWMFRWSALYAIMAYSMSTIDSWQVTIAGSIIVEPGFLKQFGTTGGDGVYSLDTNWVSAWGAVINVGQIVCMLWVPYVADRFGRKITFYCCGAAYVICLFCLTFAKTPGVWLVGKLFVGIAVGTQQLTVTPYAIELSPSAIRGGIAVFQSIWGGVCGIICSAMLQVCATRYPNNYKLPIWVLWGLAGLMLFCIVIIPETPWFYARRGDRENGMKVLKRLYSTVPGYNYEEEWGIMIRTVEHEAAAQAEQKTVSYKEVFRGTNLIRTLVVCVVFQSTIWNGTPLIGTYSTYFFAIAGESNPFTASLIVNAVALATMIVYTFVTDKLGRRYPMCGAETLCNLLMFIIGGLYYAPTSPTNGKVLIFLCCVFTSAFNILCNVYWLTAAEIPTVRTRIKTATASLFFNALSGIITCFAIPPLLVKLNIRAGFVFGATAFPLTIAMWYLLPETKGRAIAEIDELFEKRVPAWRWSSTVTEVEEHMRMALANDKIAQAEV